MAKNDSDKPKSAKPLIIFAVILALAIAIGIWVYLIRTNKFFGLGEVLRPRLKDIPIVCLILPEVTDPSTNPNLMSREEINQKYTALLEENVELQKTVSQLKGQITDNKELESKYKILVKEVERQSKLIADYEAKVTVSATQTVTDRKENIKDLVKIYESMEASEAAKILEEVGELNISLVVEICRNMKTATFAEIMQNMSTEFAAILSERMAA
jgi:flagellar motility protein MotE (MotC chaperone)